MMDYGYLITSIIKLSSESIYDNFTGEVFAKSLYFKDYNKYGKMSRYKGMHLNIKLIYKIRNCKMANGGINITKRNRLFKVINSLYSPII